eukprot:scaffold203906_cov25-Cyclotella_meneghiniana.AAC.1
MEMQQSAVKEHTTINRRRIESTINRRRMSNLQPLLDGRIESTINRRRMSNQQSTGGECQIYNQPAADRINNLSTVS